MTNEQTDVLIIGGGAAGLAAARDLGAADLSVRLLEGRSRLGGRIHTVRDAESMRPIELGAEFIHGTPPQTWDLINANQLAVSEIAGASWCWRNGRVSPCIEFEHVDAGIKRILREAPRAGDPDQSVRALLAKSSGDEAHADALAAAAAYIEGFHAARTERMSARALALLEEAAERIEGDRSFRFDEGYDSLVKVLSASPAGSIEVRLETLVRTIEWGEGYVRVSAENSDGTAEIFSARRAIITLPLGVLKASPGARGAVRFSPDLPQKCAAMKRLEVGQVARVTLCFRRRWWTEAEQVVSRGLKDQAEEMSFLFTRDEDLPTWWTQAPLRTSTLTGWAGATRAEQYTARDAEFITRRGIEILSRIFGVPRQAVERELATAFWHDWQSDPLARGSYSYVAVGGLSAPAELARPVAHTLFFAGEATNADGHAGTVHGALSTGARAAREVIDSLIPAGR